MVRLNLQFSSFFDLTFCDRSFKWIHQNGREVRQDETSYWRSQRCGVSSLWVLSFSSCPMQLVMYFSSAENIVHSDIRGVCQCSFKTHDVDNESWNPYLLVKCFSRRFRSSTFGWPRPSLCSRQRSFNSWRHNESPIPLDGARIIEKASSKSYLCKRCPFCNDDFLGISLSYSTC